MVSNLQRQLYKFLDHSVVTTSKTLLDTAYYLLSSLQDFLLFLILTQAYVY